MKTPRAALLSAPLLLAGLALSSGSAFAAANGSLGTGTMSDVTRARLTLAFTAAKDFRPRAERSLYELGREDAEAAMRVADSAVTTRLERVLSLDIHNYFTARNACRLSTTVNEYGTCEARVADRLGEKIAESLDPAKKH